MGFASETGNSQPQEYYAEEGTYYEPQPQPGYVQQEIHQRHQYAPHPQPGYVHQQPQQPQVAPAAPYAPPRWKKDWRRFKAQMNARMENVSSTIIVWFVRLNKKFWELGIKLVLWPIWAILVAFTGASTANNFHESVMIRYEQSMGQSCSCCMFVVRKGVMLRNFLLSLAAVGFVILTYSVMTSDAHDYIYDPASVRIVRHGEPGVDFNVISSPFSCDELRDRFLFSDTLPQLKSLSALETIVEKTLQDYRCVCAPMFGMFKRHIAVKTSASSILHMYNPRIDTQWDGILPSGESVSSDSVFVELGQSVLFLNESGLVEIPRQGAVRVTYLNADCQTRAIILREHASYCVETCHDLLNGKSVYTVARQK